METKCNITLGEFRTQIIASIYNILKERGFEPEEGVNIKESCGYAPDVYSDGTCSLNYSEPSPYSVEVGFLCFDGGQNRFTAFSREPDDPSGENEPYATDSREILTDSLYWLLTVIEDDCFKRDGEAI